MSTAGILVWGLLLLGLSGSVLGQQPEIVDEIWPEVQPLGRTGRLNCTVARRGENQVEWYHPLSKTISMNDGIITDQNPAIGGLKKFQIEVRQEVDREVYMLIVRRLRQQDAGVYTCIIRIGSVASNLWPKKNGSMTVQVPPTIMDAGTSTVLQVSAGQNSSLKCEATGIPYPNITWTRSDGGFLPVLPKPVFQYRSTELPLYNVGVEHMGVYRCVADNFIKPPAQHLAEVLVFHPPRVRVVQNSVGQIAVQRVSAKLECIVQGHPEPTVWFEYFVDGGRQRIQDNDKFVLSKQTTDNQNLKAMEQWYTLKVLFVQSNDFTTFYCVAENDFGKAEIAIELFETTECQGANCPSLGASSGNMLMPALSMVAMLTASKLVIKKIISAIL